MAPPKRIAVSPKPCHDTQARPRSFSANITIFLQKTTKSDKPQVIMPAACSCQAPSSTMVTFSQPCPVTKLQHSFTLNYSDLLSAKTLEGICYNI